MFKQFTFAFYTLMVLTSVHAQQGSVEQLFGELVDARANILVLWQPRGSHIPLLALVYESDAGDANSLPTRTLVIREAIPAHDDLLRFNTGNAPFSLIPAAGAHLITIWQTAAAFQILVFAYKHGNVEKIFEAGSDSTPEVLTDDDGSAMLILRNGKHDKATAEVWKSKESRYEMSASGSWSQRYSLLTK